MNGKIFFLAALVALASACAFTDASRKSDDGRTEWSSSGVALLETPADGYAKTAQADATLLFAQTVAAQRAAVVQAAYAAAANGGRDDVARKKIAVTHADLVRTKRVTKALAGAVEAITRAHGATLDDGGAR